jgi:hypothetical protein
MKRILLPLVLLLALLGTSLAQPEQKFPIPSDVKTLDGIMAAVYDVISGPAGERNWDRLRSLFVADARFIPTEHKADGTFTYQAMDVEGLIAAAKERFKDQGFYEREISRKVEHFGCIAHVFSSYESTDVPKGKPIDRGINSIQLFHDGSRWWVVSIYWDHERVGNPIPSRYLK